MNDTELIDRCRLKALLRNGYDLGLIQTMADCTMAHGTISAFCPYLSPTRLFLTNFPRLETARAAATMYGTAKN